LIRKGFVLRLINQIIDMASGNEKDTLCTKRGNTLMERGQSILNNFLLWLLHVSLNSKLCEEEEVRRVHESSPENVCSIYTA